MLPVLSYTTMTGGDMTTAVHHLSAHVVSREEYNVQFPCLRLTGRHSEKRVRVVFGLFLNCRSSRHSRKPDGKMPSERLIFGACLFWDEALSLALSHNSRLNDREEIALFLPSSLMMAKIHQ